MSSSADRVIVSLGRASCGTDMAPLAKPITAKNDATYIAEISSTGRSDNCPAHYELFSQQKTRIRRIVQYQCIDRTVG